MSKEFALIMTQLGAAYGKEFSEEQTAIWYRYLGNEDLSTLMNAIDRLILKNKYLPSIAEVKQEIALLNNPILQINIEEEWENVINAIRKFGYYKKNEAYETLKPETRRAVDLIGWNRLCETPTKEMIWLEKRFKENFESLKDSYEDALIYEEPSMTLGELKKKAEIVTNQTKLLSGGEEV